MREITQIREEKTKIDPNKEYIMPSLNSQDNTVTPVKNPVRGDNLTSEAKTKGKVICKPGDLLIGTLHTQNKNGLFAIADREYILASQLCLIINESIVPKEWVCYQLRKQLPQLEAPMADTVKRETYKKNRLLEIPIEKPTPAELRKIITCTNDLKKAQEKIKTLKEKLGYKSTSNKSN